jgi:hypothetical protein
MKCEWKLYELPVGAEAEAKMKALTEEGWMLATPTFILKTDGIYGIGVTFVCFAAFKDLTEYPNPVETLFELVAPPRGQRRDLA